MLSLAAVSNFNNYGSSRGMVRSNALLTTLSSLEDAAVGESSSGPSSCFVRMLGWAYMDLCF